MFPLSALSRFRIHALRPKNSSIATATASTSRPKTQGGKFETRKPFKNLPQYCGLDFGSAEKKDSIAFPPPRSPGSSLASGAPAPPLHTPKRQSDPRSRSPMCLPAFARLKSRSSARRIPHYPDLTFPLPFLPFPLFPGQDARASEPSPLLSKPRHIR
jgi:hypothetical protein